MDAYEKWFSILAVIKKNKYGAVYKSKTER